MKLDAQSHYEKLSHPIIASPLLSPKKSCQGRSGKALRCIEGLNFRIKTLPLLLSLHSLLLAPSLKVSDWEDECVFSSQAKAKVELNG